MPSSMAYHQVLVHHGTIERCRNGHHRGIDPREAAFLRPFVINMGNRFLPLMRQERAAYPHFVQMDIPDIFGISLLVTAAEFHCVSNCSPLSTLSKGDLKEFVERMRLALMNGVCLHPQFATQCKVLSLSNGTLVCIKEVEDKHKPWSITCPEKLHQRMVPQARQIFQGALSQCRHHLKQRKHALVH